LIGFVRESLSNVLAVMIKRAGVNEHNARDRVPLYQHLTSMISSGNPVLVSLHLSVTNMIT